MVDVAAQRIREIPLCKFTKVYDGTDQTVIANTKRLYYILREAAKQGMLFQSSGIPDADAITEAFTGSFCIDTTNHDIYIATAADWTKLTDS